MILILFFSWLFVLSYLCILPELQWWSAAREVQQLEEVSYCLHSHTTTARCGSRKKILRFKYFHNLLEYKKSVKISGVWSFPWQWPSIESFADSVKCPITANFQIRLTCGELNVSSGPPPSLGLSNI